MFIKEAEAGVKWTWTRGLATSQSGKLNALVRGVVVHHQMQLPVGAGAGDLAQEPQMSGPRPGSVLLIDTEHDRVLRRDQVQADKAFEI
jgi:hypothetical protein